MLLETAISDFSIVDIVCFIFAVGMMIYSARKGLFKIIISTVKMVVSLFVAKLFYSRLAEFLVDRFLNEKVHSVIYEKINALATEIGDGFNAESVLSKLPELFVTDSMRTSLANAETSANGVISDFVSRATDVISAPVAEIVGVIVSFVAIFVLSMILFSVINAIFNAIAKRDRAISAFNHFLGLIWGAVLTAVILLIVTSVMQSAFPDLYSDSFILKSIGDSGIPEKIKALNLGHLVREKFVELIG